MEKVYNENDKALKIKKAKKANQSSSQYTTKKCLVLVILSEIENKITMRYYLIPISESLIPYNTIAHKFFF